MYPNVPDLSRFIQISRCIRVYQDASGCIQMYPDESRKRHKWTFKLDASIDQILA